MVRVAVLGASGRMGQRVVEGVRSAEGLELVAAVSRASPPGPSCFADAQVVIDFSLPSALELALPHLGSAALVTGTTGLDDGLRTRVEGRKAVAPLLMAANFSIGIHVLRGLIRQACAQLPEADVEIVETHHRHKVDSPSGTALALAAEAAAGQGFPIEAALVHGREGAVGARQRGEIGMHAVRGGDVAGEHTVHLLLAGERLALRHAASGRSTFAAGAIRAATWIANRPPGLYTLSDVLGAGGPG